MQLRSRDLNTGLWLADGAPSPHEVAGVHQVLLDVALGVFQGGPHPPAVPNLAAELN